MPGGAHPHVFIDAGVSMVFDDSGHLAAVRVTWVYDQFTTLVMLEDQGLDPDGDGKLTETELAQIRGRDVDWTAEDFDGDLHVYIDGREVTLAPPVQHAAAMSEDGRYVTSHLRPLVTRLDPGAGTIAAKVYDPTYFVFYETGLTHAVEGRADCGAERIPADIGAAEAELRAELAKIPPDGDTEALFPEVGAVFADEIRLSCAAPS